MIYIIRGHLIQAIHTSMWENQFITQQFHDIFYTVGSDVLRWHNSTNSTWDQSMLLKLRSQAVRARGRAVATKRKPNLREQRAHRPVHTQRCARRLTPTIPWLDCSMDVAYYSYSQFYHIPPFHASIATKARCSLLFSPALILLFRVDMEFFKIFVIYFCPTKSYLLASNLMVYHQVIVNLVYHTYSWSTMWR